MQRSFCELKSSINGYWDFKPRNKKNIPDSIPQSGWQERSYLVPSFWNKSPHAVKKENEKSFHFHEGLFQSEYEYLLDGFGYPASWSNSRSAWIRRSLQIEKRAEFRYFLFFEAVMPLCRLYVNGLFIGENSHPTLPFEFDISDNIQDGENEIVLLIIDYPRDSQGRSEIPTGNFIINDHCGIWQDAWLIARPEVVIADMRISTSLDKQELDFKIEIVNNSGNTRILDISPYVFPWDELKPTPERPQSSSLAVADKRVEIAAHSTTVLSWCQSWEDPRLWSPDDPFLYSLQIILSENNEILDNRAERFGFRQISIEGANIILNGSPVRIFSDWGHKMTPFHYTEGWIRQWFAMMKDMGMNHSRLHTHPHPPLVLDMADETGLLITGETGLHGSGGNQAADSEKFWESAANHVELFVKRDKNHPSLILWSVENEMRWNSKSDGLPKGDSLIEKKLPELRKLFNRLDPTRPAYHEGDSSLWNEKDQDILSRHYGKEVSGMGWWDRTQPLLSGEMSLIHYAGPNNTLHLGADHVYRSWDKVSESAGLDTLMIIEDGRANGVCGFGPWNLSCLDGYRNEAETVHLKYENYETPGVKPLLVPAHSSEFPFWKEDGKYSPEILTEYMREAFRPVALIDVNRRTQYMCEDIFTRTLTVINDSHSSIEGNLQWGMGSVEGDTIPLALAQGEIRELNLSVGLSALCKEQEATYSVQFLSTDRKIYDSFERKIILGSKSVVRREPAGKHSSIALLGDDFLYDYLVKAAYTVEKISETEELSSSSATVLIIAKNQVIPGSKQNCHVRDFMEQGGRVLVMEQSISLFSDIDLELKSVQTAFPRATDHMVLEGLSEDDFRFWGDSSYTTPTEESAVASYLYKKDMEGHMHPLLDSGEGGFGNGDLDGTPLWESRFAKGLMVASQLRLTDCLETIPTAKRIFDRLVQYLVNFGQSPVNRRSSSHGETEITEIDGLVLRAAEGESVLLNNPPEETLARLGQLLEIDLTTEFHDDLYQLVKGSESALLSGISNSDLCGIESWCYSHSPWPNVRVAGKSVALNGIMIPLLITAIESPLKEMFVDNGFVEPLRAYTLTLFKNKEKSLPRAVCFSLPWGDGEIIVNFFDPPEEGHPRLKRFSGRLQANLGIRSSFDMLGGEAVRDLKLFSRGYPEVDIHVLYEGLTDFLKKQIIEAAEPTMERMITNRVLSLGNWVESPLHDAVIDAPEESRGEMFLYYRLYSPISRKNIETNLSVPNPEALTFLEIQTKGTIELLINGQSQGGIEGPGIFSDIALEKGVNEILLLWNPRTSDDTISMLWRNIHHKPETGFQFDGEMGTCD